MFSGAKIGMCCACGDQMHSSKTIWANGMELCPNCAGLMGIDSHDDDSEDFDD